MVNSTNFPATLSASQAIQRLTPYHGKNIADYYPPSVKNLANKGIVGSTLETLIGLPNSSRREPDGITWELKTNAMKRFASGAVGPAETVALGMINPNDFQYVNSDGELIPVEFEDSMVFKKINSVILCGILRDGSGQAILESIHHFSFSKTLNQEFYDTMKTDYELIRDLYINNATISSRHGSLLQARTKGRGHGSISRAFYWRRKTVKLVIELSA